VNLVVIVMALAILQLIYFSFQVGGARTKFGIKAPAITGNEQFERTFRVHMNTLELMVIFLPSLWMFATYVSTQWAAGLGVVYIIGRFMFSIGYIKEAGKRSLGFTVSFVPVVTLLIGGLVGVIRATLL
jgi:uncharacterized membrane protein YecN with MAPEG domain